MKHGALLLALIVLSTSASAQAPKTPQVPSTHTQSTATAAGVAARMQALGYSEIQNLHRGPDGKWVGNATRNGVPVTVTAEPQGGVTAR
jgi:hypothetical protein